jgi:hypothetical protein
MWLIKKLGGVPKPGQGFEYIVRRRMKMCVACAGRGHISDGNKWDLICTNCYATGQVPFEILEEP